MLISHRYRLIFLHNRKAAGSSITAYLNRVMGPDDLQIGVWRDAIRYGGRYNRSVLREVVSSDGLRALAYYARRLRTPRPSRFVERVQEYRYPPLLATTNIAHPSAAAVRAAFPEEWDAYYKFCVVRNPYDKAVSDYRWMTRKLPAGQVSFLEFLERLADPQRPDPEGVVPQPPTNWPLYTIDDRVAVDFPCRYERLQEDLLEVFRRVDLGDDLDSLPDAKQGSRQVGYRAFYGERERRLVEQLHDPEITTFGYSF